MGLGSSSDTMSMTTRLPWLAQGEEWRDSRPCAVEERLALGATMPKWREGWARARRTRVRYRGSKT